MSRPIAGSLYRRVLKIVASVQRDPEATRMAEAHWAEFLPAKMRIRAGESTLSVARRSFDEAPARPESLSSGFAFVREASSSLLSIELLSLWSDMSVGNRQQGNMPYDLARGVALMSAAVELASDAAETVNPLDRPHSFGTLRRLAAMYEQHIEALTDPREAASDRANRVVATRHSLGGYVHSLAARSSLQRSEATPEDFTMISVVHRRQASECLLNVLLLLSLQSQEGLSCSLAGMDFYSPWVRVERRSLSASADVHGGSPVFVSWTYGAMTKAGVERCMRSASKDWSRPRSVNDPSTRKHVLILLLRRYLASSTAVEDSKSPGRRRATYLCKELLIQLLSQ